MAATLSLPGFVNAHSHAFQRALRGRTEGGDFWAWRDAMLELAAAADARARPPRATSRSTARCSPPATRRSASSTTSGSRRRTRPSRPRPRRASSSCCCSRPTGAAGSSASGRSRRPTTSRSSRRCAATGVRVGLAPHSVRACPRRLARGARPLRRAPRACRCTSTPTSSRARSRSASPSTALRPIELLGRDRLPRPAHDRRPRDARRRARARPARRGGRAGLRLPDDRGEPRRRLRAGRGALRARDRHLHRLGLERAHRPARGAARARGDRAAPTRTPQRRSRSRRLLCFGSDEGAAALGLERWPDVEVDLDAPVARGRRRATSTPRWSSAARQTSSPTNAPASPAQPAKASLAMPPERPSRGELKCDPDGAWRSLVSALVWGTRGPEFKSRRPD